MIEARFLSVGFLIREDTPKGRKETPPKSRVLYLLPVSGPFGKYPSDCHLYFKWRAVVDIT